MSFILLGILNAQAAAGGAGVAYRLQALSGAGAQLFRKVAFDSDNNAYCAGYTDVTGSADYGGLLAKYDSAGSLVWQRSVGGTSSYDSFIFAAGLAIDSSNNIYFAGETNEFGQGQRDFALIKYDTDGSIVWQRTLGSSTDDIPYGVAVDSAGNIYVVGSPEVSGTRYLGLIKYNSAGTVQWQTSLKNASTTADGHAITIDASDNIYVAGFGVDLYSVSSQVDGAVAKFDTDGVLQWQRSLSDENTGNEQRLRAIATDSSGNVYVGGFARGYPTPGDYGFLVAKYNSSGTLQWYQQMGADTLAEALGYGLAVDSSNNVYFWAENNIDAQGFDDFALVKYDSSGSLQYQRVLGSSNSDTSGGLAIDSQDNLYAVGQANLGSPNTNDAFLAVLPNDGSLTGTYALNGVNFVYAASTLTSGTATLASNSSSMTVVDPSMTAGTPTFTAGTPTYTDYSVEL